MKTIFPEIKIMSSKQLSQESCILSRLFEELSESELEILVRKEGGEVKISLPERIMEIEFMLLEVGPEGIKDSLKPELSMGYQKYLLSDVLYDTAIDILSLGHNFSYEKFVSKILEISDEKEVIREVINQLSRILYGPKDYFEYMELASSIKEVLDNIGVDNSKDFMSFQTTPIWKDIATGTISDVRRRVWLREYLRFFNLIP